MMNSLVFKFSSNTLHEITQHPVSRN
uniref:Uncharacterized protein n=1 Tax=Anguilla anguilla TaxID=7936 RepID=A0A0E9R128_ANGAN